MFPDTFTRSTVCLIIASQLPCPHILALYGPSELFTLEKPESRGKEHDDEAIVGQSRKYDRTSGVLTQVDVSPCKHGVLVFFQSICPSTDGAIPQLGIAQLEQQALEAIRTSLTPPIILRECLSLFTSKYVLFIWLTCNQRSLRYEIQLQSRHPHGDTVFMRPLRRRPHQFSMA